MVLELLPHPGEAMRGSGGKLPALAASGLIDSVGLFVLQDLRILWAPVLRGRPARRWRRLRALEFPSSGPVLVVASFPPAALQGS